jgi:hypothetical protein
MTQCQSVTRQGTQCTRRVVPGRRYCWQHTSKWFRRISVGSAIIVILTIIGLAADLVGLGLPIPTLRLKESRVPLRQPRFTVNVESFDFSLGEKGFSVGYEVAALEKKPAEPYNFNGFKPVKLYVGKGVLYADVSIYGGSGMPPLKIRHNQLSGKPPDWDFNSNETAFEVVTEHNTPIYQFYYKTPTHIVVNGVFPFPGGLILAGPEGAILNPFLPASFRLKPIFKYPSWKYPGKYAE